MAGYLPFWSKGLAGGHLANGNSTSFFSLGLPTNGFTEVVVQVSIDNAFGSQVNTLISVLPQISNDGVNWEDTSSIDIIAPSPPTQETVKYTNIASFMRMKITVTNSEGAAQFVGAFLQVSGVGRS